MDTNNTQINSFSKGMNTDVSNSLISPQEYRLAKNIRLTTTNKENDNEIHLIEGVTLSSTNVQFKEIYAVDKIRNIGVVIGVPTQIENVANQDNKWCIYKFNNDEIINDTIELTLVFGPCSDTVGNMHTVMRYESNNNVKLYIADGVNYIYFLNIADVTTPKTEINEISAVLQHQFRGFESITKVNGFLKPALVQYAYVLYNEHGSESQISPLSKPQIVKDDINDVGYRPQDTSNTGFSIVIGENTVVSNYDKIRLYRITYNEAGTTPIINLIADGDLPLVSSYTYVDTGTNIGSQIDLDEFTALQKYVFIPKTIESKNDYLFAANIKDAIAQNQQIYSYYLNEFDPSCQTQAQENNMDVTTAYDSSAWGYDSEHDTFTSTTSTFINWKFRFYTSDDKRTLRAGEVYRYGIMLYDKYGTAWPVKWVCDVRVPEISITKMRQVGLEFSVNLISMQYIDNFNGFEIVRCNRTNADKSILARGIAGTVFQTYKYNSNDYDSILTNHWNNFAQGYYVLEDDNLITTEYLCPTGILTNEKIISYSREDYNDATMGFRTTEPNIQTQRCAKTTGNYMLFACPEYCYDKEQFSGFLKSRSGFKFHFDSSFTFKNSIKVDYIYRNNGSTVTSDTVSDDTDGGYIQGHYGNGTQASPIKILRIGRSPDLRTGMSFILSGIYNIVCDGARGDTGKGLYEGEQYKIHKNYLINQSYDYASRFPGADMNAFYTGKEPESLFNLLRSTSIKPQDTTVEISVDEINFIDKPTPDSFFKDGNVNYKNSITSVGTGSKKFISWSAPLILDYSNESELKHWFNTYDVNLCELDTVYFEGDYKRKGLRYPTGVVGESMIISLNSQFPQYDNGFYDYIDPDSYYSFSEECINTPIVDIRINNNNRYGGSSTYAKNNSKYSSFGTFVNHTVEPYVFVSDGDCFITKFYYNALTAAYNQTARCMPSMSTVYDVIMESEINMDADYGDTYKRTQNKLTQDIPYAIRDYVQERNAYVYNMAYSQYPDVKTFLSIEDKKNSSNFDCRVFYSNVKENQESVDSWVQFKALNFIDVDTRFGEITNLKLFNDKLLFWQGDAIGVLSVNDRNLIQTSEGQDIIVGTGDVLQRYDYLSTIYGMRINDNSVTSSNEALYWWDYDNKQIVTLYDNKVLPINKYKNISNYINTKNKLSKPALLYDTKNGEVLFNVVEDGSLVYSENIKQFTSIYDILFNYSICFQNRLILFNNNNIFIRNNEQDYDEALSTQIEYNEQIEGNEQTILTPYIKYIVNQNPTYTKVYDNMSFGGKVYSGNNEDLNNIHMKFNTPLGQESVLQSNQITNREYDFRLAVPRNNNDAYGGRMRGKTMQCELWSDSNSTDFSIQYITTKYRISWT